MPKNQSIPAPSEIALAQEAIKLFGGVQRTADALGIPQTTVSYWQKVGIPAWRLGTIRQAAKERDIKLPKGLAA